MRSFRISMGSIPLMVTVGVVAGSMVLAFYVGFASGRSVGFDEAYVSTAASAPKLPLSNEETASISEEELASRILAQLNERADISSSAVTGAARGSAPQAIDASQLVGQEEASIGEVPDIGDEVGSVHVAGVLTKQNNPDPFAISAEPIRKRGETAVAGAISDAVVIPSRSEAVVDREAGRLIENAKANKATSAAVEKSAKVVKAETKIEKKVALKAESKVEVKKAATTTKSKLSKGWFAQVAAPQSRSDAETLLSRLSSSGFRVVIDRADVNGQSFFRVLVGPEESKTQGDRLVQQLKRERYIKGDPFLRNVK